MSSLTLSPRRGGAAPSRLFHDRCARSWISGCTIISRCCRTVLRLAILALLAGLMLVHARPETKPSGLSQAAAERCSLKLKSLEDYANHRKGIPNQATQFSEDEANSYLALNLSRKYHPS